MRSQRETLVNDLLAVIDPLDAPIDSQAEHHRKWLRDELAFTELHDPDIHRANDADQRGWQSDAPHYPDLRARHLDALRQTVGFRDAFESVESFLRAVAATLDDAAAKAVDARLQSIA